MNITACMEMDRWMVKMRRNISMCRWIVKNLYFPSIHPHALLEITTIFFWKCHEDFEQNVPPKPFRKKTEVTSYTSAKHLRRCCTGNGCKKSPESEEEASQPMSYTCNFTSRTLLLCRQSRLLRPDDPVVNLSGGTSK